MAKVTDKKLCVRQRKMELFFETEYELFIFQSIYGVVFFPF